MRVEPTRAAILDRRRCSRDRWNGERSKSCVPPPRSARCAAIFRRAAFWSSKDGSCRAQSATLYADIVPRRQLSITLTPDVVSERTVCVIIIGNIRLRRGRLSSFEILRLGLGRSALAVLRVFASRVLPPRHLDPVVNLNMQSSIAATGPAASGTEVTIRGTGFAAGLGVTIGGRAASDVSVRGNDMMTGGARERLTGVVDIAVAIKRAHGTNPGGLIYEPFSAKYRPGNRIHDCPPARQPSCFRVWRDIAIKNTTMRNPRQRGGLDQWRACGGNFVGTGPVVDWTAPPLGTLPADMHHRDYNISAVGRTSSTEKCRATAQLSRGSQKPGSRIPRGVCQLDPSSRDELSATSRTRDRKGGWVEQHDQQSSDAQDQLAACTGPTAVNVAFGSYCKSKTVDACAVTSVEWNSTVLTTVRRRSRRKQRRLGFTGTRVGGCATAFTRVFEPGPALHALMADTFYQVVFRTKADRARGRATQADRGIAARRC